MSESFLFKTKPCKFPDTLEEPKSFTFDSRIKNLTVIWEEVKQFRRRKRQPIDQKNTRFQREPTIYRMKSYAVR